MTRYEKLGLYLQACDATPFAWWGHDCCRFAGTGVLVQTGADPMADVPRYHDREGAEAVLAANGGLASMVTQRLGEPIPVKTAQRGDVVMFDVGPHGPALGICVGSKFAAAGPDGLAQYSMRHAVMAWRVA